MNDYVLISRCLNDYARACDERNWRLLAEVFHPEARVNYGGYQFESCEQARAIIESTVQRVGPTQHLLGNLDVLESGEDWVRTRVKVRAVHAANELPEAALYEVWGEYRDKLVKVDNRYQIIDRQFVLQHEVGDRDILQGVQ